MIENLGRPTNAGSLNDPTPMEKNVLRWGGLAGILGGVFFILSAAVVIGFGLPDPGSPEALARFPELRVARTLENGFYLVAVVLWTLHSLALYRALRGTSPASALFGCALSVMGLVVLAAGALPHVASLRISDVYHAAGTSSADKAALALVWQANYGIFEALLAVGILLATAGLIVLGVAMLGTPAFGKALGWVSVGLGVAGVVAGFFAMVDPSSAVPAVGLLALTVFHLALGWRTRRS
jgi:hypothetical protein